MFNTDRIDHLYQDPHVENRNLILHYGDLTDSLNLTRIIGEVQPDEIYNLAAMSHVKVKFRHSRIYGECGWFQAYCVSRGGPLAELDRRHVFIRHLHPSCMAWCRGAAEENPFLSEALSGSETIRLLDYGELQGRPIVFTFQWHLV